MNTKCMTKHSSVRFQQRGFKKEYILIISDYGERIIRNGSYWVVITKQMIRSLMQSKYVTKEFKLFLKQNSEKICKKVLIESFDGTIITVMNLNGRINYE